MAELESVLLHHVVPAKVASSFVTDGLIATTTQGNLTFIVSGGIFVTDALTRGISCQIGVDSVDIFRSNGVIHSTACVLTPKSLADVVVENGLIQLATAAQAYGVLPLLLSPARLTLFGPTDAAFSQVNLTALTAEQIADVLGYHTLGLGVPSSTIALYSGLNVPTAINATFKVLVNGTVTLTDSLSQVATVTIVDKFALNGILHVIDSVLIPGTIVQIAATNPLTNIVAAVAALFVDTLTGIAIFLPTNAALIADLVALSSVPGRTARYVFQNHFLTTKELFSELENDPFVNPGDPVPTAASVVFFNLTSLELIITYAISFNFAAETVTDSVGNTRQIIDVDIVGTDGVVSIIDGFLFPFDINSIASIDATAKGTPDLSTLVTAYTAAGLDTDLAFPNVLGLTIFAPLNSAFAKLPDGVVSSLLANIELLESVLSFHVYNGTLLAQDIALLLNQGQPIKTLAGIDLVIGLTSDLAGLTLIDPAGNVITITTFDVFCTNGVIHIIDTVIEPEIGAYNFTISPSNTPSNAPSNIPSSTPTVEPTVTPTVEPTVTPTVEPTISPALKPTDFPTDFPTSLDTISPTQRPSTSPNVAANSPPIKDNKNNLDINIVNEYIIYGNGNNIMNNNFFDTDMYSNDIIQCACFDIIDILNCDTKCYIDYMGGKIIKTQNEYRYQYIIDYDEHNCKCYKNDDLIIHELSVPDIVFNICINALNTIEIPQCTFNAHIITIKALNDITYMLKGKKGAKYQIGLGITIFIIISILCVLILKYMYKKLYSYKFKYTLVKHESSLSSSNISQNDIMSESVSL